MLWYMYSTICTSRIAYHIFKSGHVFNVVQSKGTFFLFFFFLFLLDDSAASLPSMYLKRSSNDLLLTVDSWLSTGTSCCSGGVGDTVTG